VFRSSFYAHGGQVRALQKYVFMGGEGLGHSLLAESMMARAKEAI
jgi:hypothetical protein